ncbi:monovalent cation/H+ antiporter subunit E [Corynebacterium aquilae DSM 44791]|uniref:Monovalent cation/H+ antiporter subunit E n=1 Tax=Corynebacterium aquilae DSM 44791 TaxID=1431546 RepID=A0A1L7CDD7_9CORY|nr:monovalent cation/H+ antiporter subunit E [Corynebacterium aquilae DSM 44791]
MGKVFHAVGYGVWLFGQVYVGAWEILRRTLKPSVGYCPVVVRYPLRVRSQKLIAAFSTSITMTPGTMSIGLRDPDAEGVPRTLLVHAVFGEDPDEVLAGLRDMEERLAPEIKGRTGA